jgi:hypothetical protein
MSDVVAGGRDAGTSIIHFSFGRQRITATDQRDFSGDKVRVTADIR